MKSKLKASKLITATLLIFVFAVGIAFGSNSSKITVNFENLKYFIQNKEVKANPNTPGFIYEGTTYVPLRFMSEALGQTVAWDNKTKTIKMTSEGSTSSQEQAYQAEIDKLNAQISSLNEEIKQLKSNKDTSNKDTSDKVTYITHQHGNLTLMFTPTAYEDYGYLHTDFDKLTKEMFKYFGEKDVKNPVKVYIQSDNDRVERPNSGAFYESGERVVVINPDMNFEMAGHDSVKFVFIHELSHAMQDATWGFETLHNVTRGEKNWILEGHADYIAKKLSGFTQYGASSDPAGAARDQAYYYKELHNRNGAEGWKPLDWSSITTFQQLSLHRDEYFAFEAIVNFIATNYSLDHYGMMLDEMAKGKTGAEAIQAVFKKSDTDLMKEYKTYYKLNRQ